MIDDGPDGSGIVASDMFFGLAAILVVLIALMSQTLRAAVAKNGGAEDAALLDAARGQPFHLVLAGAEGLTLANPDGTRIDLRLDDILDGRFEDWSRSRTDLLVLLRPEARDSAFLLDTALARAGITRLQRIRLDRPCPAPQITLRGVRCG